MQRVFYAHVVQKTACARASFFHACKKYVGTEKQRQKKNIVHAIPWARNKCRKVEVERCFASTWQICISRAEPNNGSRVEKKKTSRMVFNFNPSSIVTKRLIILSFHSGTALARYTTAYAVYWFFTRYSNFTNICNHDQNSNEMRNHETSRSFAQHA